MIPTEGVATAHRRLYTLIEDLTDDDVQTPSVLPGWTRGHVLAHVTDAGRAMVRLVEQALLGNQILLYDPAVEDRDGIIEATAGRSADEHRAALREHSGRLEDVWTRVEDWTAPVRYRDGKISSMVFARWREVWIHATDLDLGLGPDAWPEDFCVHAIDFLQDRLPDGVALRAGERTWLSGAEVSGDVHDLAAWLSGRFPGQNLTGTLPDLLPWPSAMPKSR